MSDDELTTAAAETEELEADEITDPGPIPVDMPNPMQPAAPTIVTSPDGSQWVMVDGQWVPHAS